MRPQTLHPILLLSLVAGLAVSLFAAYEVLHPALQASCSVSPYLSCQKVDQSAFTTTLGVPDWAWGVGGFVLLIVLDLPLYRSWKRSWLAALLVVSAIGLALSAYFLWVEVTVIQAVCLVCAGAYVANLLAFAVALSLARKSRAHHSVESGAAASS